MSDDTLPDILERTWGKQRAPVVVTEYQRAFQGNTLMRADLALFCGVGNPNEASTDFERGANEGKRRVWLHIARLCGLRPEDFTALADGEQT